MISFHMSATIGAHHYSVGGYSTREKAEYALYCLAQDNGDWHPPKLRDRPWQFWRPKEYTELEKRLIARVGGAE